MNHMLTHPAFLLPDALTQAASLPRDRLGEFLIFRFTIVAAILSSAGAEASSGVERRGTSEDTGQEGSESQTVISGCNVKYSKLSGRFQVMLQPRQSRRCPVGYHRYSLILVVRADPDASVVLNSAPAANDIQNGTNKAQARSD
ncbi:hypothetical protein NDA11_007725 [Ustilago hordei]|uniref:Uncharacterized protein n=1 Tax=Ustilago hordei TaxID=120017 RepID=I2FS52_USTHO|nr:uncharacterized protein UHO2_05853 [Ustilago hordei]KAJ1576789.1 hypothetical protein NDA11_007725 [Ustilago hordei]KAJ1596254.1 hypothetical protein NDA14_002246 [Ustilago hordei]CCF49745.1 uncharacterized protein UHOR_08097 [Ustilago hordei]SYW84900.1 uncharacterized protein UHO2_05853 [Ustilago hordei]